MRRRTFLKLGVATLAAPRAWRRADDRRAFLLSRHGCGRATGYAEANKIVSRDGKRHVAWLDSEGGRFLVRARTLDEPGGAWSEAVTVGEGHDNHGGPALTQDAEGFLHLVWGPHHHPFRYRRSKRPNDASEWDEEQRFGERCTYPTLVTAPDGVLLCSGRVSFPDRPWEVHLFRKPPDAGWSAPQVLMRGDRTGYSHFQEALAWAPDRGLHLSVRFYSVDRGHTVGHAVSRDEGATWTSADGTRLPAPFTSRDLPHPIAQDRETQGVGLRCGALALDGAGTPHVLYSSYDALPMQTWLATHVGQGRWRERPLRECLPEQWADWGLTLPGGIVFTAAGECLLALTLIRPPDTVDTTLWGHPSSELVVLRGPDAQGELGFKLLTAPDPARPRWLPSLERPTAARLVERPGLIYTDGGKGAGNADMLANDVRWVAL